MGIHVCIYYCLHKMHKSTCMGHSFIQIHIHFLTDDVHLADVDTESLNISRVQYHQVVLL